MSSIERTAKRTKNRTAKRKMIRQQQKALSKGLNNLRLQRGELVDDSKTLFDLIALFEITLSEEQITHYAENDKFVVVSLDDPNPNPEIKTREGVIYFPPFGLQALCMVNTQGARTTIYIMGNKDTKYLAVNSFLNFFDVEEQLKITGYYVAKELAAYFNDLMEPGEGIPPVALNETIGGVDEKDNNKE